MLRSSLFVSALFAGSVVFADPIHYQLDVDHTFPSIEVDHGGFSTWRGKFNKISGSVVLDRVAKTGEVEATIDVASIDFGRDALNAHVKTADMLDVKQFPIAVYKGKITHFNGDEPTEITGELTLHGITKPVTLQIQRFKCVENHPMQKTGVCGVDATGTFNRSDFGIDFAVSMGFSPEVKIAVQAEAIQQKAAAE